ncbi:hypothetical protein J6590_024506 [Homalodisca vitripennis]|nr:hypothetical protein J6590_024506 [Homalodisca vitripennis]
MATWQPTIRSEAGTTANHEEKGKPTIRSEAGATANHEEKGKVKVGQRWRRGSQLSGVKQVLWQAMKNCRCAQLRKVAFTFS